MAHTIPTKRERANCKYSLGLTIWSNIGTHWFGALVPSHSLTKRSCHLSHSPPLCTLIISIFLVIVLLSGSIKEREEIDTLPIWRAPKHASLFLLFVLYSHFRSCVLRLGYMYVCVGFKSMSFDLSFRKRFILTRNKFLICALCVFINAQIMETLYTFLASSIRPSVSYV